MKHLYAEYIESGTFVGGEEQSWDAGIRSGDLCAVIPAEQFQIMKQALEKIANYESEPIWSDDRNDAANEMVRIAQQALSQNNEEEE